MTMIQISKDGWIESFVVPRSLIGTGAQINTTHVLTRAGRIIGVSSVIDADTIDGRVITCVKKIDNTAIVFGDTISQIVSSRANFSGVNQTFGHHIVVFMSK